MPETERSPSPARGHRDPLGREQAREPVGLRAPHAHRRRDAGRQLGERRLGDEPAVVDDHDPVDRLLHLGEHVAGDEHAAAARREGAQEVAQPAHPLGVEAVRRLVEDEQLRLAEQRRREPEALPHPERVALHAPARCAVELDEPKHLVDAREGDPGGECQRAQVLAAAAARVEVGRLEHGADPQRRVRECR